MGHVLLRTVPLLLILLAATACEVLPKYSDDEGESPGHTLYIRSCARCHSLHMPGSFTAGEWKYYVRKYGPKARLSDGQQKLVYDYLAAHALVIQASRG